MSHLLRPASFCSAGESLYLNEELSDLSVIVKSDSSPWRFPAHSLVLAAESSVFRSLLEKETSHDMNKEIIICDMTPSTVEQLLRYMYCGKLDVENWTEALNLLQAAFKYKVDDLVKKCERFLENILSLSNVCYIYEKTTLCTLPVLQDKCLKLILDAGFVVLRSSAFEVLSKDCVMDIVSSSNLNVDSELVVFESLLRWARLQCSRTGLEITETNILNELKPFLQHVCVDDMSDADKSALPSLVLSCVKPNNRNRIGFSALGSLLLYSQRLEFEMNQNCLDFIGENMSCLRFSVDSPVHLVGLRFTIVTSNIPLHLPLTLVKENVPKTTMFTYNLAAASWIESLHVNQRVWHDAEFLLRQPVLLRPGDIYNMYVIDIGTDVQCPEMVLPVVNVLRTFSGLAHFSVHGEDIWGVTCFIFI